MDATKYIEKKKLGAATVAKVGGAYAVSFKKFNQDTGVAENDEVQAVDIKQLEDQKKALQAQITDIDAMLTDITSLK